MQTYRDVIDRWPSTQVLAEDVGEKWETVRKWRYRNSIPADKWELLLAAAVGRKIRLSAKDLVRLAAPKPTNGKAA